MANVHASCTQWVALRPPQLLIKTAVWNREPSGAFDSPRPCSAAQCFSRCSAGTAVAPVLPSKAPAGVCSRFVSDTRK